MKVLEIILEKWHDTGKAEFIKPENNKRASSEMIAEWKMDAWKHVATNEWTLYGFRQCGHIDFDRSCLTQ